MTAPAGELPSQESPPPVPSPTDTFAAALPVLYHLYGKSGNEQKEVTSQRPLPLGASFAGSHVVITSQPTTGLGARPHDSGEWHIEVPGRLDATLTTFKHINPGALMDDGNQYFDVRVMHDGLETPATADEEAQIAGLVGLLTTHPIEVGDPEQKGKRASTPKLPTRIGSWVTHLIHPPTIPTLPAH